MSTDQLLVALLGELHDFDCDSLMLDVHFWDVGHSNLSINVATELLHLVGLTPEIDDVYCAPKRLDDVRNQGFQSRFMLNGNFIPVERELYHVLIEGAGFLAQPLDCLAASFQRF